MSTTGERPSAPEGAAGFDVARALERMAGALFGQSPGFEPARAAPPPPQEPSLYQGADPTFHAKNVEGVVPGVTPLAAAAPFSTELGPVVPPRIGPSALAPGAGGASPAVMAPPIPGPAKALPPVEAPPPREADLRAIAGALGEHVFGVSAVPLVQTAELRSSSEPYYLSSAGFPAYEPKLPTSSLGFGAPSAGAYPGVPGLATPSAHGVPGVPDLSSVPGVSGAPGVPGASTARENVPALPSRDPAVSGYAAREGASPLAQDLRGTGLPVSGHVVKRDFPILNERVHGNRLVWLDNGATTQKPQSVIDRVSHFYEHENSNIHRAAHALAARATDAYEGARNKVRDFLGAKSSENIVFVRGTTEAINLVAQTFGRQEIRQGDEILISWLEHHANIVPWQMLCAASGARLVVAPVDDHGELIVEEYQRLLTPRTKLVAITHVSNALGTITPVAELTHLAKKRGATVLIDGAQAVSHMPVDVSAIGCDFYVFSGHKVFAPTGIGALYGRPEVLAALPPWQGGGNMISDVTFEKTTYQPPPFRFEAGTGNIADAVGLGAAIDYVSALGMRNIEHYEQGLLAYGTEQLRRVPGLRIIGNAREKAGVMSFTLAGYETEEIGKALDQRGIAVRSGHHCAQPILRRFGVESTVRASLAPYNTCEDLDALVSVLHELRAQRPQ